MGDDEEDHDDDSGDNDSVVTVKPIDIDRSTLVDMCRAVKAFIGESNPAHWIKLLNMVPYNLN